MKENELTIEIPNDKVVDWEESKKQNKIVLKDKQMTYEDICKKLFKNGLHYITVRGKIDSFDCPAEWMGVDNDANNASTKHQLDCILAKNMLANVAKYLNNGWKPKVGDSIFYLNMDLNYRIFVSFCSIYGGYYFCNVVFKSKELAQQAIEILGEETVKLALEPLGF